MQRNHDHHTKRSYTAPYELRSIAHCVVMLNVHTSDSWKMQCFWWHTVNSMANSTVLCLSWVHFKLRCLRFPSLSLSALIGSMCAWMSIVQVSVLFIYITSHTCVLVRTSHTGVAPPASILLWVVCKRCVRSWIKACLFWAGICDWALFSVRRYVTCTFSTYIHATRGVSLLESDSDNK